MKIFNKLILVDEVVCGMFCSSEKQVILETKHVKSLCQSRVQITTDNGQSKFT